MLERFKKYFWDGETNISEEYRLRRIIEYASFPDLISYPFDKFKMYARFIDPDKMRTSDKRKMFIKKILPFVSSTATWDEVILKMMNRSDQ